MHRNFGWKRCAGVAALLTALAAVPLAAHSQNVMNNLLNSLGGGLGSAITGGKAAPAAQGDDLISLLTQSLNNIDEPKEIEIGRQLAALLLGGCPETGREWGRRDAGAPTEPTEPTDQRAVS